MRESYKNSGRVKPCQSAEGYAQIFSDRLLADGPCIFVRERLAQAECASASDARDNSLVPNPPPPGYRAWLGIAIAAITFHAAVSAAPQANDSPVNEPKAIIEALIGRDFKGMFRYTSGSDLIEYRPLFESYPPYGIEQLKVPAGKTTTREVTPTFGKCTQEMLVKDIKVTKVQYAQDPTPPVNQPKALPYEVYVTVEAEVLALRLFNSDKVPADRRCSWLGLEVKNTQTGKREAYLDNADDGDALLKMMKQFGTVQGEYVVIDPHRRQWSYGISLFLPRSGNGQYRHYDHEQRKYVDAVEPRWLIQDPFPPRAVYLGAAITRIVKSIENHQSLARGYCTNEIERATGKKPRQVDFQHPACAIRSIGQRDLDIARRFDADLEVLRKIK